MTTTAADWISATRRHLFSTTRDEQDTLNGAVTNVATTLVATVGTTGLKTGAYLGIDAEVLYVSDWNAGSKTATVLRGQLGSTAAAHADKAVVYVNPRYTDFEMFVALNAELGDLSSPLNGLFRIKSLSLTYNPSIDGYDLAGVNDFRSIWRLNYDIVGPTKRWPRVRNYRYEPDLLTADFASTQAIVINEAVDPGRRVLVRYRASFDPLAGPAADVTTTGLHAEAWDIPAMGAAIRLASGAEITRNALVAAPSARRAEEVPAGAETNAPAGLRLLRMARVQAEAGRLAEKYPDEVAT